jgi:hypothetical protein
VAGDVKVIKKILQIDNKPLTFLLKIEENDFSNSKIITLFLNILRLLSSSIDPVSISLRLGLFDEELFHVSTFDFNLKNQVFFMKINYANLDDEITKQEIKYDFETDKFDEETIKNWINNAILIFRESNNGLISPIGNKFNDFLPIIYGFQVFRNNLKIYSDFLINQGEVEVQGFHESRVLKIDQMGKEFILRTTEHFSDLMRIEMEIDFEGINTQIMLPWSIFYDKSFKEEEVFKKNIQNIKNDLNIENFSFNADVKL